MQVAVGGGDHADVDSGRFGRADSLEFALLQDPQQLGLQFRIEFADLVEKQRSAVGQFEAAHLVGDRAGERSLDVAEQLALDQAGRQGRAG